MEHYNFGDSDTLPIDEQARSTFLEMSKWTKFLAILGFVFLGLMIIAGLFIGLIVSNHPTYREFGVFGKLGAIGIVLIYLVIAAYSFYPVYALLKYSTGMKKALETNDRSEFNTALTYLKNMFKFIGVSYIILLCIYALLFVFKIFL